MLVLTTVSTFSIGSVGTLRRKRGVGAIMPDLLSMVQKKLLSFGFVEKSDLTNSFPSIFITYVILN